MIKTRRTKRTFSPEFKLEAIEQVAKYQREAYRLACCCCVQTWQSQGKRGFCVATSSLCTIVYNVHLCCQESSTNAFPIDLKKFLKAVF